MVPRKLLLVPILSIGLLVSIVDAPAKQGEGGGTWKEYDKSGELTSYPPGWMSHRPAGVGDGRRIK